MTTIGLSYSLVKISTKCAPALGLTLCRTHTTTDTHIIFDHSFYHSIAIHSFTHLINLEYF